jgi:hypothetical protein
MADTDHGGESTAADRAGAQFLHQLSDDVRVRLRREQGGIGFRAQAGS